MPLLAVENISISYRGHNAPAVDDVSFALERGEIMALLGPSGSGKTSILRSIGGFVRPTAGQIVLAGSVIDGPDRFVPAEKREVGFVFQEFALFPHMTVLQNVMYGLRGIPAEEARRRAKAILDRAQLSDHTGRKPAQLSGGQQQRVAIARAMAPRPHIILMDEPFGSLDPGLRDDAHRKIHAVLRDNEMSAIMVTHDQEEALSFADRVCVIRDGRLEQMGTPQELYNAPATTFVAAFIGGANILQGKGQGETAATVIGSVPLDRHVQGNVTLAVRPEHIELDTAGNGGATGEIVSRSFHGHDVTIDVRVGDQTITVWDDYRCRFEVGDRVSLRPRSNGVVVDKS